MKKFPSRRVINGSRSVRRRHGVAGRRGVPRTVSSARAPGAAPTLVPGVLVRGRPAAAAPRGAGVVAEAGAARLPRLMRLGWLLKWTSN